MFHTTNDPPPRYTNHESGADQVLQCADNVLALDRLYQDLTLAVLRTVKDPPTEELAKDIQQVSDVIAVHFPSSKLINAYRRTPTT